MKINIAATTPQKSFIEILCVDLSLDRIQRKAILKDMFQRDIKFLDQLTKDEASAVIVKFKEWKEQRVSKESK
jgi:hypothetical protein